MEPRSHLAHAALEHFTDVSRFGQDVHVWDAAQVHGGVDVEALGLAGRGLPLHWAMIDPQVTGLLVPLCHHSVPLAQRHGLRTDQDGLA